MVRRVVACLAQPPQGRSFVCYAPGFNPWMIQRLWLSSSTSSCLQCSITFCNLKANLESTCPVASFYSACIQKANDVCAGYFRLSRIVILLQQLFTQLL